MKCNDCSKPSKTYCDNCGKEICPDCYHKIINDECACTGVDPELFRPNYRSY